MLKPQVTILSVFLHQAWLHLWSFCTEVTSHSAMGVLRPIPSQGTDRYSSQVLFMARGCSLYGAVTETLGLKHFLDKIFSVVLVFIGF